MGSALETAWRAWPKRPALIDGDLAIPYGELRHQAVALSLAYTGLGIRGGDRIVCQLPNCPEMLLAAAGAWLCGAVHVPADDGLTVRELESLVQRTGAAATVCRRSRRAAVEAEPVRADIEVRLTRRSASPSTSLTVSFEDLLTGHWDAVTTTAGAADDGSSRGTGPTDPALILPTSGTTGIPKLPIGYNGPLHAGWRWLAEQLGLTSDDVHLGHLPLSHGFGLSTAVMALLTGGRIVLMREFSAENALNLISRHRVTVLHGTPTHFTLLTRRRDPGRHDVRTLRVGIGTASRFPPALVRSIFSELDMDLMLMYGSSEGVSVVTTDREEILAGCVGHPDPGWVSVFAPDGLALQPGDVGEIAFRRDMWPVSYWENEASPAGGTALEHAAPALSHAVDPHLWYRTGDLGRLDAEGRLYVLGRLKHQIDRGGLKVDPGEVEDLLVRCPGVADAAVVGAPNPVLGEVVCACVVRKPGSTLTLAALRARLAEDLAPFKLPEELCVLHELPRTASGKVDRGVLAAQVTAAPRESVHAR